MLPLLWTQRASPYEYQTQSPLDSKPGAFRLIKLLPPLRTAFGSTLRIELITADSVDACAYDTLSYTWGVTGKSPPDRRIIVETSQGSRELYIYRPLEVALEHIRTDRPLFVDQICINQKDDEEKATQVQLMQAIYSNCARLLIWLGSGTKASDAYFDIIRDINAEDVLARITHGFNSDRYMQAFNAVMDPNAPAQGQLQEDRDDILRLISKYGDKFPLDGAADLLRRQWFYRLWTIQEVCLAPSVLFICGSRSLCFDCFRMGMLFFNTYNTHWLENVKRVVPKAEVQQRSDLLDLQQSPTRLIRERKNIHHFGTRRSLYDIILHYNVNGEHRKIGATLAEDRVFGIMGMAEADSFSRLRVNYDNTSKVFLELAGILFEQNPDVLLFSQFPKDVSGLPSWVPDWSMNLDIPHGYTTLQEPNFGVWGEGRATSRVDYEAGWLTVKGVIIDSVAKVGKCEIVKDPAPRVSEGVEYTSVRRLLGELDEFLTQSRVKDDLEMASIHIADFGMAVKDFKERYGDEASDKLRGARGQAYKWGQRLIHVGATRRRYELSGIWNRIRTLPGHFIPGSDAHSLHLWATDPIPALSRCAKGAVAFLYDAADSICSSVYFSVVVGFSDLRRKWIRTGMDFHSWKTHEAVKNVGLDPAMSLNVLSHYGNHLFRSIGSKIYLTKEGHVGTGPGEMKHGDVIAALFGMTVPVVLRRHTLAGGKSGWLYLGEAYCYGTMNGEILKEREETSFDLL